MVVKSVIPLLAVLGTASGHTIMQAVGVNGQEFAQGHGIYMPSDDSFIADPSSDSMACNGPPVTGFQSSTEVIPVKAGDVVTGSWLHTLTSTGPDEHADNKVIDSSHKGPVMAYMKKVDDATQNPSAGPGDGWFKVSEAGLLSSTEWAVDALIEAGGVQSVTIPTCLEDGDYLLRFEIIALHDGSKDAGAQFYMECAQVSVSGGTGAASPETYSIPGIYSSSDPGVLFNVWNNNGEPYPLTDYPIPGPEVFSCGSQSSQTQGGADNQSSGNSIPEAGPDTFQTSDNSTTSEGTAPSSDSSEAECEVQYVYA